MKRNIKLTLAYDGTDFAGWQRQTGQRTVQGVLEEALEKLHGKPTALSAAGRTDAGVHAAGQAANFYTTIETIPAERFTPALNGLLPRDVRVLEATQAAESFHARFDARLRTYRYVLICGRPALPHETRYALHLWRRPRLSLLEAYARQIRGEMDCSLFASPADPAFKRGSGSHYRFIQNALFYPEGDRLIFEISANAFLWKMVRTIVGTLLFFEERGLGVDELKRRIEAGERSDAGPTAAPQGLFLWRVDY